MYSRKYIGNLNNLEKAFCQQSEVIQLKILFKVLQNDIRYLSNLSTKVYKIYSGLLASQKEIQSITALIIYKKRLGTLKIQGAKEKKFVIGTNNNLERIAKGQIPLVHFAFDKWQSERNIKNLKELTVFYTYKLLELPNKLENKMELIGSGAYFYVYKPEGKNFVYKYPKNYLAKRFLLEYEFNLGCLLGNSDIARFLPKIYGLDKEFGLKREFIKGETGNEIIKSGGCNNKQKNQLAKMYGLLCKQEKKLNSILDIHPGNFVWSHEHEQWFFIDLGFVPKIGSNYYPKHNFTRYYKKIWLNRLEMIRRFPIRSVDI